MASNSNANSIPTILAKAKKRIESKIYCSKGDFHFESPPAITRRTLYGAHQKFFGSAPFTPPSGQLSSEAIDKAFAGSDNTFPAKSNVRKYLATLQEDSTTESKLCNKESNKQIMLLEKYPDMAYQTRMRWGLMPITLSWLTRKFRDANSAKHFNSGLLRFLLLESQVSESNGPANSLTVAPASNATTVVPASNAQATEDLANVLLSAVSAVTGNFDSSSKMNIHGDVNTKTEYNTTNNNYHSAGINKETLQGMFDSQTQEIERMVQDSAQDHKDQMQHLAEQVAQTLTAKKTKNVR